MQIVHLTLGRPFGRHVGIRCVPPSDGIASAVSGNATLKVGLSPLVAVGFHALSGFIADGEPITKPNPAAETPAGRARVRLHAQITEAEANAVSGSSPLEMPGVSPAIPALVAAC